MIFEAVRHLIHPSHVSEKGVTSVEYAIMLALVAIVVAVSSPGISEAVTSLFVQTASAMQ